MLINIVVDFNDNVHDKKILSKKKIECAFSNFLKKISTTKKCK